jgi:hypothetical protein
MKWMDDGDIVSLKKKYFTRVIRHIVMDRVPEIEFSGT